MTANLKGVANMVRYLLIFLISSQAWALDFRTAVTERNFAALTRYYLKGVVKPTPWVGFWWDYLNGGIANPEFSKDGLSPTNKFDLMQWNDRENNATLWEHRHHGKWLGQVPDWWGHCDGWSAAALMVPEPKRPRRIGGVTFSVADQKALLSEWWLEYYQDWVGLRVQSGYDKQSAAFYDVVPAQFHLILTNMVGRHQKGFVFDRHTGAEVWNQPVVAYEMEPPKPKDYLGADPRYPNVYRINVTLTLWWASDDVHPNDVTGPFVFSEGEWHFDYRTLRYELWLDGPVTFDDEGKIKRSGNIILTNRFGTLAGGAWKNAHLSLDDSHPDFMWLPLGSRYSTGYKNPYISKEFIEELSRF